MSNKTKTTTKPKTPKDKTNKEITASKVKKNIPIKDTVSEIKPNIATQNIPTEQITTKDEFVITDGYVQHTTKLPIISVKNLTKSYGNTLAVDDINFEVFTGEVFGILGPNGAGKTTTMEIMETVIIKTSGEVRIDGLEVDQYPFEIKKRIGIQLQSTNFFPELTLKEIIDLFTDIYCIDVDIENLLSSIGLTDKINCTVDQLSKGQQQRFSLATCLISNPKIIFLDEPTTGLDPQARRSIWNIVKELQSKGVTIVLTTHYMEEAEFLCDRVAIMDNGKIIEVNSVKDFIGKLLIKGFKREVPKYSATLDDVFIELTGRNLRD